MQANSREETKKNDLDEQLIRQIPDLFFEAAFRNIRDLLLKKNISLILLKGPHLAHALYDQPGERTYGDLDILVKPADFAMAARVLLANEFTLLEDNDRSLATAAQTNHWVFSSPRKQLIELHRGFTGLDRHPGDMDGWFARAEAFHFGQTPALGLGSEDLLCHLCLHIGKGFFYLIEEKHIRDLDMLIRRRAVRWDTFIERCRETRSRTIAYYCLLAAQARFGTPVPAEARAALRPGKWRRFWLDRHLDVAAFPIYRFHARGVSHSRRSLTLPLLDGAWNWVPFLAKAGFIKGLDVVLRIPVLGKWWKRKFDVRRSKFKNRKRQL